MKNTNSNKNRQNLLTCEQQLFIIESLPNIGPVNAKNLLEHFGTVANIINASESQLQEVEGIGKNSSQYS